MSSTIIQALGGERARLHQCRHAAKLKAHPYDAGIDLYPNVRRYDPAGMLKDMHSTSYTVHVPTGVAMLVPRGMVGLIRPRSSTAKKLNGLSVVPGTIDADYTGEIFVSIPVRDWPALCELARELVMLTHSDSAIAQMLVVPHYVAHLQVVEEFPGNLTRKGNGYGSTDLNKVTA